MSLQPLCECVFCKEQYFIQRNQGENENVPAWKKIGKEEGRKPEWLHHNCCGSASFSPESWCKHSAEAVQLSWRFQFNVSCFETWMTAVLLKQSEQHHDEGEKEVDLQHLVVQSWRFPVHTPCPIFYHKATNSLFLLDFFEYRSF